MKRYGVIYADPPWSYGRPSAPSMGQKEYCTMSLDEMKRMNVEGISDDNSLLFMWSSGALLEDSLELMAAWGFKYRTIAFIWNKKRPAFGKYTMPMCELVLVGKRGNIPKPRGAQNVRQHYSIEKSAHSVKPKIFRDLISKMFPTQNKLEMFARDSDDGWDVFGNEAPNSIDIPMRSKFEMRQRKREKICRIR